MVKTFFHSGKKGDLCFSLPAIRALSNEAILYLPEHTHECGNLYSFMKPLLEMQSYIKEVRQAPDVTDYHQCPVKVDYDMDEARKQSMKGKIHIVKRYLDTFGIELDNWREPWLMVDPAPAKYCLINWTGRHLNNKTGKGYVDWSKEVKYCSEEPLFVGTDEEYHLFSKKLDVHIGRVYANNCLQLARLVAGAHTVHCNQSLVLSLSQAVGARYYLEVKHGKTNCIIGTKNEHIL